MNDDENRRSGRLGLSGSRLSLAAEPCHETVLSGPLKLPPHPLKDPPELLGELNLVKPLYPHHEAYISLYPLSYMSVLHHSFVILWINVVF